MVYGPARNRGALQSARRSRSILKSTAGHNTIFNVNVSGQTSPVIMYDWQHDPSVENSCMCDMKRIDPNERMHVRFRSYSTGIPEESRFRVACTRSLRAKSRSSACRTRSPIISTECHRMAIRQAVRASDIPLSGSMRLLTAPETVISHVVAPRAAEATEEVVAAAVASPK